MQEFTHLSTKQRPLQKDEPAIAAALSAMGMNIGLQKMAESSDDVNYQHHLPLARIWGDGSTSSSDEYPAFYVNYKGADRDGSN